MKSIVRITQRLVSLFLVLVVSGMIFLSSPAMAAATLSVPTSSLVSLTEDLPIQSNRKPIEEIVIENSQKFEFESFVIEDERINPMVINKLFLAIEGEDPQEIGRKRCTKWKNGRRFCVQREGFLNWRFGWEYL
jgi:hypothetical protein